jgi:hypothetical protein
MHAGDLAVRALQLKHDEMQSTKREGRKMKCREKSKQPLIVPHLLRDVFDAGDC